MSEDLNDRVGELEKHRERVEARLDGGAKAFDAVRKEIDKLVERTAPKPLPIWQILGVVIGTLVTVLGVWWQARGEIDAKASTSEVGALQKEVQEQRVILTGVKLTGENTALVVGEMKADAKQNFAELKADIRLFGKGK